MARKNQSKPAEPKAEETAKTPEPEKAPEKSETQTIGKSRWWARMEKLQDIGILIAMLLGLRQKPAAGSQEEAKIPNWILAILPEEFSDRDETWRNIILSCCSNRIILPVEETFRKMFLADPEIYDAGKYRTRLMDLMTEHLEQARKPVVKNEAEARLIFEPITFRNPCNDFFLQLIEEAYSPGTPEEIYERQKAIAIGRDFLVKMGGMKKWAHRIRNNKILTIAIFFTGIIAIFTLLSSIIYYGILG